MNRFPWGGHKSYHTAKLPSMPKCSRLCPMRKMHRSHCEQLE